MNDPPDPHTRFKFGIDDMLNHRSGRTPNQETELLDWLREQQLPHSCVVALYLLDELGHSIEVHRHCCPGDHAWDIVTMVDSSQRRVVVLPHSWSYVGRPASWNTTLW